MKKNTLSYLALLIITPCAQAQDSPQKIDIIPSSQAPQTLELHVVPTEVAAADFANSITLQTQLEEAHAEFEQPTSAIKTKELELGIADLKNRLAELNAASRQQEKILQLKIQEMLEVQKKVHRAAKAQAQAEAQAEAHFGGGSGGNSEGGFGGFTNSIDLATATPNWLIGVQVQNHGDQGLKVLSLSEGFPASAAGFKKEDIILSANGLKLKNSEALRHLIQAAEDQQLEFVIKRGEEASIKLHVTPKKNKKTAYSYRPVPLSVYGSNGNSEPTLTIPPTERQSDARLEKNLNQHPELKKLLNDYFEKLKKD